MFSGCCYRERKNMSAIKIGLSKSYTLLSQAQVTTNI